MSQVWRSVAVVLLGSACRFTYIPAIEYAEGDAPDLSTPSKTDDLLADGVPTADVLWVLDSSCSMAEERQRLLDAAPTYFDALLAQGLDWHVGLVSMGAGTDRPLGALSAAGPVRFVTSATPDPAAVFAELVTMEDTEGGEQGLLAAQLALQTPTPALATANAGFLRDEASLHGIHLVAASSGELTAA